MRDSYDSISNESLIIGRVSEVSPGSIMVEVDREAPHGTSLVNGALQRFPTVNGLVALPCEDGAVLAIILWIGVADTPWDGKPRDRELLGLPEPRRRIRVLPLGVLRAGEGFGDTFRLERGALVFPTVGDPVRLPTPGEMAAAVPFASAEDENISMLLGTAPMAANSSVKVSANRLFAKHLAILGNTGSGKSCSLAHLIRESAQRTDLDKGTFRAIIFDLNGEYGSAFSDLNENIAVRRFTVDPNVIDRDPNSADFQLRVPYWLWNFREWLSFSNASGKSQAPVLRQALHMVRTTVTGGAGHYVATLVSGRRVVREFQNNLVDSKDIPHKLSSLQRVQESLVEVSQQTNKDTLEPLRELWTALNIILESRAAPGTKTTSPWKYSARGLDLSECRNLNELFDKVLSGLGMPDIDGDISSVDTPIPFDAEDLVDLIELIAADSGNDVAHWVAPMQERLAVAMSDKRLKASCGFIPGESLQNWIESILGTDQNSQVTILDLSLIPSQAQHVIASVVSRVLLEVLERYKRLGTQIPVILAVEEAHALMKRQSGLVFDDAFEGMARLCRESFERIGREGRKFGLSLVISSQRPSELSETVLSQCNSFLIHRIVNSRDQELVRKLVPDDLGGLLTEVSSYPAGSALLLGAATEIPVLTKIVELAKVHRPSASDPDFSNAWTQGVRLDSKIVADSWLGESPYPDTPREETMSSKGGSTDDIETLPDNWESDLDFPPF